MTKSTASTLIKIIKRIKEQAYEEGFDDGYDEGLRQEFVDE